MLLLTLIKKSCYFCAVFTIRLVVYLAQLWLDTWSVASLCETLQENMFGIQLSYMGFNLTVSKGNREKRDHNCAIDNITITVRESQGCRQ